ncbi:MAG TPA: VOC family protein [Bryobacteraceae bacterium]|nr:VOC family protein [Bryobacteraceae bacterium]
MAPRTFEDRCSSPIHDLFETHLTVADLQRSMAFYGGVLGLELARVFPERNVAFYWIGGPGKAMLGLWETGTGPLHMKLHLAFSVDLPDLLEAPARLQAARVTPRDFAGNATGEPVVLAWMPAASVFFHDPDGHQLELLCMLPDSPEPELGVLAWSCWLRRHDGVATPI